MKLTEQTTKSGDVEIVSEYGSWVRFGKGEDWVDLDGSFEIKDLEEIIAQMKLHLENVKEKP